jgi:hypothetical protein
LLGEISIYDLYYSLTLIFENVLEICFKNRLIGIFETNFKKKKFQGLNFIRKYSLMKIM